MNLTEALQNEDRTTLKDITHEGNLEKRVMHSVDTVANLMSTPLSYNTVYVNGYRDPGDGGGGVFHYEPSILKSLDNGGTIIDPTASGTGYGCWAKETSISVSVIEFGAICDGVSDDTDALQRALDTDGIEVVIPLGVITLSRPLSVKSNTILRIDGTLMRYQGGEDETHLISNKDKINGNSNIFIVGTGAIDGNRSNQNQTFRQSLIDMKNIEDLYIRGIELRRNIYDTSSPGSGIVKGCAFITNGTRIRIQSVTLTHWGREGVSLDGEITNSIVENIVADGSIDSWSSVQVGGPGSKYNIIDNVVSSNCGASSVGMDSEYSVCNNIVSSKNRYHNGVNFGHAGAPCSHSVASNITVKDAGCAATSGSTHNGINIGSQTSDFVLVNCVIDGSFSNGVNCSNLAHNIRIVNVISRRNRAYGVNLYNANNSFLTNCDFSQNVNPYHIVGSLYSIRNTIFSETDRLTGSIVTKNIPAGGDIQVNNKNITPFSSISWVPRHAQSAAALFFQNGTASNGNITMQAINATDGSYSRIDYTIS